MRKLIVANWKMYLTHNESLTWAAEHLDECAQAASDMGNHLVICPSFTTLPLLTSYTKPYLAWGAQDCGFENAGAYTGDVSATSLAQLGCAYGIVGHSERRTYYKETNEVIAQKAQQLMGVGIIPILCIGETAQEREAGKTAQILEQQLFSLLQSLKAFPSQTLYIAYEPRWAIGTDKLPTQESLIATINWIRHYISHTSPTTKYGLLYGGSVKKPETLSMLKQALIDGILVGRASTDGPLLKKIILSW